MGVRYLGLVVKVQHIIQGIQEAYSYMSAVENITKNGWFKATVPSFSNILGVMWKKQPAKLTFSASIGGNP